MRRRFGTLAHLPCCLFAALIAAGCASSVSPDAAPKPFSAPFWPKPPDSVRFRYEYTLRNVGDVQPPTAQGSLRELLAGESRTPVAMFEKPLAVAASQGRIYVTDSAHRHVLAMDIPRRRVFRFGLRKPGTLQKPAGISLDAERNVYVADIGRREVIVYDSLGLYQKTIGGPQHLQRPTGVAASPDGTRIYVIDRADNDNNDHRVVVFDGKGRHLKDIGARGSGPGHFNIPLHGAVAPDGTLYVMDAGNFRVQAFDREGTYLRSFGRLGVGPGQFSRPRGIATDHDGNVYVADSNFGNVQVFNSRGELLIALGRLDAKDAPGVYGLASGVAVDETGRVYVVDQLFNKVEVIRRAQAAGVSKTQSR